MLAMALYPAMFPESNNPNSVSSALSRRRLIALLSGAGLSILSGCRKKESQPEEALPPLPDPELAIVEEAEPPAPPPLPGLRFTYPTPQTDLLNYQSKKVYMPTGAGRIESAWYGSVRTNSSLQARFHEGFDIAPTKRDRKNRALDPIYSVTNGRVGYISRIAGNSSYGRYVVILHQDRMGEYYSLYAHLSSVPDSLKVGQQVGRGTIIGQMGNSTTLGLPVYRSHLHFEFGTILNARFATWYKAQKLKPDHGWMHGHNLTGLNPKVLFEHMQSREAFVLEDYMPTVAVGCQLLVPITRKPDYYVRYPSLWSGDASAGAMVMDVSEGAVPLQARAATTEERALLTDQKVRVLSADASVLGRNGKRIVVKKNGQWQLGKNGQRWLEIFLYPI